MYATNFYRNQIIYHWVWSWH